MRQKKAMKQTKLGGKQPAPRKTMKKKGVKFIDKHVVAYGLKIGARNAAIGQVETVLCRFCSTFGREKATSSNSKKARASPSNPKYFNSFRTDLYQQHLDGQHPAKWGEYTALSTELEKQQFFETPEVPFVETLEAVFESEDTLQFTLSATIVDVIIGLLLFHPDQLDGLTHARIMAIFAKQGDEYKVSEKRPSRFRLCVRFLGRGASFRMASNLMDDTKEETGIGRYGGCNEATVARYARIVCAASLQILSTCLATAWTFSLALDCGTHQGKSYVDVRCRFYKGGAVHNYHLLAIPLYDRHTAANIFKVVQEFLDALVPQWRYQLLGVATDGAATMVGHITGLATLLEKEAKNNITRVWCGLHQLNLKMQVVFQQALNETYLEKLTSLIGHLRRQQNLIAEMQITCPKVASTRWLSMYSVTDWLCKNGFKVRAYLTEKESTCAPNIVWWIFLYALREVAREANAVFVSLQGMSTLVKQQEDRFAGLVQKLLGMSGARGPLSKDAINELDSSKHEIIGNFAISHAAATTYMTNLDLWVCASLQRLGKVQTKTVVVAVARMHVLVLSQIHTLTQTNGYAPPVTPRELVTSTMVELAATIEGHHDRLLQCEEGIDKIGQEFKGLSREYNSDKPIRTAIEGFDHRLASFQEMWQLGEAASRFPTLARLCGGIATVFPNTATVESDFSLIGCEKTDRRTSLTDLSLEGILHCKQWQRVSALES